MAFNIGCACASACALAACVPIHSVQSNTDTPLAPLIDDRVEAASLEYDATSSIVAGYELNAIIQQSETCQTTTTPRVHRRRFVHRHADPGATRATWGLALAGIAAGAYGYVDAENLAARSAGDTTPDQFRQYSVGAVAIGMTAALIGIVDAVRARDSDFDDGVIEGQPTRTASVCRRQPARNIDVTLPLADDHSIHARTDDRGAATFSFLGVPGDVLPDPSVGVTLVIHGERTTLRGFESQHLSSIRDALLAEPRSQLAMEVLQRRRNACSRAVNAARVGVPAGAFDVSTSARGPWLAAKATCADLWTPEHETELVTLDERIVSTECRHRLERASAAFSDDSGTTVGEMTDELAALHELCTADESVEHLRQLDAKLASTVKRLERDAAAEARRAAREQARARAEYREALERARVQRSFANRAPSWPSSTTRACCKVCSTGKACGNSCIARWKTCHKGVGCACNQ
ncbi:MAG: hypothetical protein AB7P03_03325 [Kofleriaceae bacterium]